MEDQTQHAPVAQKAVERDFDRFEGLLARKLRRNRIPGAAGCFENRRTEPGQRGRQRVVDLEAHARLRRHRHQRGCKGYRRLAHDPVARQTGDAEIAVDDFRCAERRTHHDLTVVRPQQGQISRGAVRGRRRDARRQREGG